MPTKTVVIDAADLKPGHILRGEQGFSRVDLAVSAPGGENLIVGVVQGRPRRSEYHVLPLDSQVKVTARSHAYVMSPQRRDDLSAAQVVVSANKNLLRPQALDLSRGEAVSLNGLTQALRDEGSKQQAAVLQRLPGLRVQIDPDNGLVLTERPATLTLSAAQSWAHLQEEARLRKLRMFADPASPQGVMDARYRTEQGEYLGIVSRISTDTGAVRTAPPDKLHAAEQTLDKARQRTLLDQAIQREKAIAWERENLQRPQAREKTPKRPSGPEIGLGFSR